VLHDDGGGQGLAGLAAGGGEDLAEGFEAGRGGGEEGGEMMTSVPGRAMKTDQKVTCAIGL